MCCVCVRFEWSECKHANGSSDPHNVYRCTRKTRTIVKCGMSSPMHCHCPSMLRTCIHMQDWIKERAQTATGTFNARSGKSHTEV